LSNKNDLLAIGHTAFDYIMQVNEFPLPNSSTAIKKMQTLYGGAAANVAVVASSLGLKSSLVSAVGNDFIGSEYENILKNLGIDSENMIIIKEEKTPTAFVLTDSNNDQISYFYWGAANKFKSAELPCKAIDQVKAVHLATGDPGFNRRSGEVAHEKGKLISFDPGQDLHMYSKKELESVIKICDILFGNHHEIKRIQEILMMSIDDLREFGPNIVVTTHGEDGSTINTDKEIKIEALISNTVDPTGAGDSYRAGFLNAYLKGEDLETCGKFASTVASFVVEAEGCQTNVPDEKMVKERMENMWQ
jgi:sugar/nucleoside kinase (ribokinase family)